MKSILFRSIGVSLFLVCLTFSTFAEGEMGTGSKTGNGSGLAPTVTTQTDTKTDDDSKTLSETDFFGWLAEAFAEFLR